MWTPELVKQVIQTAHEILSTGHHHKGALAVDREGNIVPVDSEAAYSFCEWGAVEHALCLAGVRYQSEDFVRLENQINDVINAANPSKQYEEYKSTGGDQGVTFRYNDSLLSTDEVVARFNNALSMLDDQPEVVKALVYNPVKTKPVPHMFVEDDF